MFEDVPQAVKDTVAGGGAITIVGLFARWFLRQLSRDKVAGTAERSEISQIARLENEVKRQTERADVERARADQAFHERNEAIRNGAEAIAEVGMLRREVEGLKLEVESLREMLRGLYGGKGAE